MECNSLNNTNENVVLSKAMDMDMRESFLRYRGSRMKNDDPDFLAMKEYILSPRCTEDIGKLLRREYDFEPPHHYRVPKNFSNRKRDVYSFKGDMRHLFKLINYSMRDYDCRLTKGLYSFRASVTAKDFLLKLRNFENVGDYYIVKADVSNYVGSIVPELIIPRLEKLWPDDTALLDLMKFILLRRECIERDGSVVKCEPGGLGGIPLSNYFMNVYLMELDEYFEPRSPLYCRYSDDLIIFASSREEAEEYIAFFHKVLREKNLGANPDKTCLIEPGGDVEILGFTLSNGRMGISDHAKRKIMRKIRICARKLIRMKRYEGISDKEAARKMVYCCNLMFFGGDGGNEMTWSRWLFPVINDASSLVELDRYTQDAIRYVITGTMADKRYRIGYQQLKDLGYRSLVHAYYHFEHDKA